MVLITGSKSETPALLNIVSKDFRDLKKYLKKNEIEVMQSWLQKQPHLPDLTDEQLLVFLHGCNYSVEKSKETLDNYYTLRTRAFHMFADPNIEKVITTAFKISYFVNMPETVKTYDGSEIIIMKLIDSNPANAVFLESVKTAFALIDLNIARFPLSKGTHVIMDMEGLVVGHLTKIDFSAMMLFMKFIQGCTPFGLKAIHVINTIPLINQIMTLVKPLLGVELFDKITFYTSNEFSKLTEKHIPLTSLPSDFGGSLDSLSKYQDETYKQMLSAVDWFQELGTYKVNESKRLGSRRTDLNVCDGSFRKLEID